MKTLKKCAETFFVLNHDIPSHKMTALLPNAIRIQNKEFTQPIRESIKLFK